MVFPLLLDKKGAGVSDDAGGGAGGAPSGPTYLFLDEFTTPESAPLTSPRTAEPGPGTATITDTNNVMTIGGGKLDVATGGTDITDPAYALQTSIAHAAGRAYGFRITAVTNRFYLTMNDTSVITAKGRIEAAGNPFGIRTNSGAFMNSVLPLTAPGNYWVVRRESGGLFFGVDDELGYVDSIQDTDDFYAWLSAVISTAAFTCDYFFVADFGAPWDTDYGIATTRIAGSVSAGTDIDHVDADSNFEFTVDTLPSSGEIVRQFRRQDASNYLAVVVDSTGALILREVVADTPTDTTVAAVITAGERVFGFCSGTAVRVFDSTQRRINATKANFQTETAGRLDSLGTGGAVSNDVVYPRTLTGAAKTVKDNFFQ